MFAPMLLGAVVGSAASCLSLLHHYKQQLGPMSLREARQLATLPTTPIALASAGLVKLVGTVGASVTTQSYYHRVPCAALEHHHYEVVDSVQGPRRMLVRKDVQSFPFWIEDETGRVAIDPAHARIDYEVEGADLESTVEEHRLRVGERVSVLAVVRRVGPRLTQPMRQASSDFAGGIEFVAPPLVTWRSEPEVYPRLGPPASGLALSAGSIGLAVLGSVLNL